jgi:hypothetical protein
MTSRTTKSLGRFGKIYPQITQIPQIRINHKDTKSTKKRKNN